MEVRKTLGPDELFRHARTDCGFPCLWRGLSLFSSTQLSRFHSLCSFLSLDFSVSIQPTLNGLSGNGNKSAKARERAQAAAAAQGAGGGGAAGQAGRQVTTAQMQAAQGATADKKAALAVARAEKAEKKAADEAKLARQQAKLK